MQYIISEDELKELVNDSNLYDSNYPGNVVKDFLKSKKPVEEIKPISPDGEMIKIDFSKYKIYVVEQ